MQAPDPVTPVSPLVPAGVPILAGFESTFTARSPEASPCHFNYPIPYCPPDKGSPHFYPPNAPVSPKTGAPLFYATFFFPPEESAGPRLIGLFQTLRRPEGRQARSDGASWSLAAPSAAGTCRS